MILRLNLLDLGVDEALRVQLLRVDALQVLLHRHDALLCLDQVCVHHDERLLLLLELLVQRTVGLVGKFGQIIEGGHVIDGQVTHGARKRAGRREAVGLTANDALAAAARNVCPPCVQPPPRVEAPTDEKSSWFFCVFLAIKL